MNANVNWIAVLVAALSTFLLGGLWYSPALFGRALGLAIIALFERWSWGYIAINGSYMTVAFVVMGVILGAWR